MMNQKILLFLIAFKVLPKEFFHRAVEIKTVFLVMETVAFIVFHHILHDNPTLLQRLYHLVRFVLVYPWIVGALRNKQGRFDLIGI